MPNLRLHGVVIEVSKDSRTACVRDPRTGVLLHETGAVTSGGETVTAQVAAIRWAKARRFGEASPLPPARVSTTPTEQDDKSEATE